MICNLLSTKISMHVETLYKNSSNLIKTLYIKGDYFIEKHALYKNILFYIIYNQN